MDSREWNRSISPRCLFFQSDTTFFKINTKISSTRTQPENRSNLTNSKCEKKINLTLSINKNSAKCIEKLNPEVTPTMLLINVPLSSFKMNSKCLKIHCDQTIVAILILLIPVCWQRRFASEHTKISHKSERPSPPRPDLY